jgi:cytochrome P450
MRKAITPTFHFKSLEKYLEIMGAHGDVFVEGLRDREGQEIEFFEILSLYTLDVICGELE